MLTDEQKAARKQARDDREHAELADSVSGNRIGMKTYKAEIAGNVEIEKRFSITLSEIENLSPSVLTKNPLNTYAPLEEHELDELTEDVKEKGVLVSLIARPDGVLICGHNRLEAATRAGLGSVPVQTVTHPRDLSEKVQKEIMRSENDRRRGGKWNPKQQKAFIERNFGSKIREAKRGGDRKSKDAKNQTANGGLIPIAKEIHEKSRGKVSVRSAERRIAELRKKSSAKRKPKDRKKALKAEIARLKGDVKKHAAAVKKAESQLARAEDKLAKLAAKKKPVRAKKKSAKRTKRK